jgi:tripartite-type tricarboxylate transporter receptor subunit TctC
MLGVGAPKDTPAEVIDKLNNEINAVAADPLIKARLAGLGVDPMSMTSAAFGKLIVDRATSPRRRGSSRDPTE